ncbi:AfsR/SARP family transcriptional regulator [Streptomyces sp. NPDC006261]|uniref:AfsR/SARP family transcriptional regulator n=1 Tax=Streptomyces sp. NPDC006261 TaxID=3156739 RepID=UPI0033A49335
MTRTRARHVHRRQHIRNGAGSREPRFLILGPLEVSVDGTRLSLGGAVQERVLSVLPLEPGRVVPMARLIEAAWEGDPPTTASHQVRKAVSELRRRIPGDAVVSTEGSGYRATVTTAQLDLLEFNDRIRAAEQALRENRRTDAVAALEAALALRRGSGLAGQGGTVIESAVTVLEERWLVATEELFTLRLGMGLSGELVADLRIVVSEHPLRETLHGHLMLALYRTGRKAEALHEYARLREVLADQLGVEPVPQLARLHEEILRDDPGLVLPQPPRPPAAPEPPEARPAQVCTLPQPLSDFTGRSRELSELLACVDESDTSDDRSTRVVAVDGMGGSGKTSLAVRAAHQLADRFPDGQLHVDCADAPRVSSRWCRPARHSAICCARTASATTASPATRRPGPTCGAPRSPAADCCCSWTTPPRPNR